MATRKSGPTSKAARGSASRKQTAATLAPRKVAAKRASKVPSKPLRKPSGKPAQRRAVLLGTVSLFGADFSVLNPKPSIVRRELRGTDSDKDDIRCELGSSVRWSSRGAPFRIQFNGAAPDLERPEKKDFRSTRLGGQQQVQVLVRGHSYGSKLDYDIFSPPNADCPLDPTIIIEPSSQLSLIQS